MARRILALLLSAVLVLSIGGCVLRRVPSGEIETESRDVSGFDEVEFSGVGSLIIEQGSSYKLEMRGPSDVLERVRTEVKGDRLEIGVEGWSFGWMLDWSNEDVQIRLTVPELSRLSISGAGKARVTDLRADRLRLGLSGAGELDVRDLVADSVVTEISGAGEADISGKAAEHSIDISGAGSCDARDLESEDVEVSLSGAGSATVWAKDRLEVRASGSGEVEYYGQPKVDSEISGAAEVRSRGEK